MQGWLFFSSSHSLSFSLFSCTVFHKFVFFSYLGASYNWFFFWWIQVIYYCDWHSGQIKKPKALCEGVNGKCLMNPGHVFDLFTLCFNLVLHISVLFSDLKEYSPFLFKFHPNLMHCKIVVKTEWKGAREKIRFLIVLPFGEWPYFTCEWWWGVLCVCVHAYVCVFFPCCIRSVEFMSAIRSTTVLQLPRKFLCHYYSQKLYCSEDSH